MFKKNNSNIFKRREEMKRIVIPSAGGYEKLQMKTIDIPKPGKGEVLVRTFAVGVNYAGVQ